ncbi:hypothetical protein [Terriglobus roseus]|uniref:hypothetical protein n=1 Tax=Terriglobus roseus TaxID=392734 RepID=UPI0005A1CECC|nr:hypothetical protein [Terriglobus roseus]
MAERFLRRAIARMSAKADGTSGGMAKVTKSARLAQRIAPAIAIVKETTHKKMDRNPKVSAHEGNVAS